MREFVLRARKGPSTPDFSLDDLPAAAHMEIVAQCIGQALFYSARIREQVRVHVVFDGPARPPKTVRFESEGLGSLGGFDERALAAVVRRALAAGRDLHREEEVQVLPGVFVAKRSFEALVRQQAAVGGLYHLRQRGRDLREAEFGPASTFVFSDHLSMPKKADKFMQRLGAQALSVGPKTLFASQCIVLVHNELDRRRLP